MAERTVFLTGATGFLGKVVLEALLRRRQELGVGRVVALVRASSGEVARRRLETEVLSSPCFSRIPPEALRRVEPLAGDLLMLGAVASWIVYTFLIQRYARRYPGLLLTRQLMLYGALALLLLLSVQQLWIGGSWYLASEHVATLGWVVLMIVGVAYRALPRFSGHPARGASWARASGIASTIRAQPNAAISARRVIRASQCPNCPRRLSTSRRVLRGSAAGRSADAWPRRPRPARRSAG